MSLRKDSGFIDILRILLMSPFYHCSVEMLTDDQIASLMLDAQLEAVCERLAGVASRQPQSPEARY